MLISLVRIKTGDKILGNRDISLLLCSVTNKSVGKDDYVNQMITLNSGIVTD